MTTSLRAKLVKPTAEFVFSPIVKKVFTTRFDSDSGALCIRLGKSDMNWLRGVRDVLLVSSCPISDTKALTDILVGIDRGEEYEFWIE